jgi:hypothetical protein
MSDKAVNPPTAPDSQPDAEVEVAVMGRGAPLRDPHALLTGRPPIQEYLSIAQQAADGSSSDIKALMEEWRRASDHITALTHEESGAADGPSVPPLPAGLAELRATYLADPVVMRSFAAIPI